MRLNDFVKQSGGQRVDEYRHPPSMFDPDPENVRFDTQEVRDHIRGLANSIKEEGVREPLTCREVGGRLVVINGNMRLTAVRLLLAEGVDIALLPWRPEPRGTNEMDRAYYKMVANSGLAHTPLEMAAQIKKLLAYGQTDAQIAARIGKSRAYVSNVLELAGSSEEVRAAVINGTVSATQALSVVRKEGSNAAAVIAAVAERVASTKGKARVTAKDFDGAERKPRTTRERPMAAPEVAPAWVGGGMPDGVAVAVRTERGPLPGVVASAFEADEQFEEAVDDATHAVMVAFRYLGLPSGNAHDRLLSRINDAITLIMREYVS